jgi:hypothetical protein
MRLSELRSAISKYAARFDPALVSGEDAARVVEDAATIEKMAAAVKSLAAARIAETEIWKRDGDRSAAHQLARTTGTTVRQAQETLAAARRLEELPDTAEAARRGELSAQQVAAITDAAGADPGAERRLLERPRTGSLGELRDECARTKANACDAEQRRRRIHERRCLRTWHDTDGASNLHLCDNPEVVAGIMAALEPIRDELFEAARKAGRQEPLDAYAAERARRARPPRRPRRCDAIASPEDPRSRRPAGAAARVRRRRRSLRARRLRARGGLGDPRPHGHNRSVPRRRRHQRHKSVVGVAHLGRRPTVHQHSALEWLHPTCGVEGCTSLTFLETDHRQDWAKTHTHRVRPARPSLQSQPRLKTRENWALVEGRGKRAFVSPDDPRHPRNAHAPPVAAA